MTTPDPFPGTLEQLFGSGPTTAAAVPPAEAAGTADLPAAGGAASAVHED